tara:strand:+ start:6014 stop:6199 length:186 start_codon:yes stop_codon:yes gene_type:complete
MSGIPGYDYDLSDDVQDYDPEGDITDLDLEGLIEDEDDYERHEEDAIRDSGIYIEDDNDPW